VVPGLQAPSGRQGQEPSDHVVIFLSGVSRVRSRGILVCPRCRDGEVLSATKVALRIRGESLDCTDSSTRNGVRSRFAAGPIGRSCGREPFASVGDLLRRALGCR